MEAWQLAAAVIGTVAVIVGLLTGYHRWFATKAIERHQLTEIMGWFRENKNEDSLPTMVKQGLTNQAAMADQLDAIALQVTDVSALGLRTAARLELHLDREDEEAPKQAARIDRMFKAVWRELRQLRARVEEKPLTITKREDPEP